MGKAGYRFMLSEATFVNAFCKCGKQGSQAGPKQRIIRQLSSWENQRAGLVGAQSAWKNLLGGEGVRRNLGEQMGRGWGEEGFEAGARTAGQDSCLGFGFSEEGLRRKRNCFPEGLRETCQVTVCGREQGSGPRIPLWTPHGGSEIRVFLLT